MGEYPEWENGIVGLPKEVPMHLALDKVGSEGWEPWAILGTDEKGVHVAVKRIKRRIVLANEGLIRG